MSDVRFKFGIPRHGWMDVMVSDGEQKISLDISDVPFDSIHDLTGVLLGLQAGMLNEEVKFSLEPEFALWRFTVKGSDLVLEIFPDSGRDSPITFKGQKAEIVKRLYKALRDLESLPCWKNPDNLDPVWSWDFPSSELRKFKDMVQNA